MITICYSNNTVFRKFVNQAILLFCATVCVKISMARKDGYRLQIVSEVYKKQPYIQVPTAWIDPKLKSKIIRLMQKSTKKDWELREIKIQDPWTKSLKCHAAVNIGVWQVKKKLKRKNMTQFFFCTLETIVP